MRTLSRILLSLVVLVAAVIAIAYIDGRTLQLAFFSGAKPPTFTPDAIATTTDLCGTYGYSK